MSEPYFIYCSHLVVYRDVGFNKDRTFGYSKPIISKCECELYQKQKSCPIGGRCIIARENDTWKMVNKKSWEVI